MAKENYSITQYHVKYMRVDKPIYHSVWVTEQCAVIAKEVLEDELPGLEVWVEKVTTERI